MSDNFPIDKGMKNGHCNRSACLSPEEVVWYNHSTRKYYCWVCAQELNRDRFNRKDAWEMFGHDLCTEDKNEYTEKAFSTTHIQTG